jgi:predicted RNA-binding Zn-ribbon protein involved in translation (DUF1610 family)
MPSLSANDSQWLVDRIVQATGGVKPCPECGNAEASVSDEVGFLPQIHFQTDGENKIEMGNGTGLAIVSCTNCGLTKLFNVGLLGFKPGIGG